MAIIDRGSQERSGFRRESTPAPAGSLAWQTIAEVLQRLQADLDRAWTLERMARTAGYQVHHFARCFRAVVGAPPLAYLRRLRLERAAYSLVQDARSASQMSPSAPAMDPSRPSAARSGARSGRLHERFAVVRARAQA